MDDVFDDSETPSHEVPVVRPDSERHINGDAMQAVLVAMRSVLQEMKALSRKVDAVTGTVNNHATSNAVTVVKMDALDQAVKGVVARVEGLENGRDELIKSVLAKAITLVLVLSGGIAAAAWIITHKSGG